MDTTPPTSPRSDDLNPELAYAAALARGDEAALRTFDARYRSLLGHALGVGLRRWRPSSPISPEDLVQDCVGFLFVDGGARLRSFEGRSPFGAWLYTLALRYFQRRLARESGDRRVDEVLTRLPDREDRNPEHELAAAEEADRVRQVVNALPAEDRLLIRLFYVEDLNAQEVARTLGKGSSAIRMKKMRLLERLRGLLGGVDGSADSNIDDEDDEEGAHGARGIP